MTIDITKRTITELVISIIEMNEHLHHITTHSPIENTSAVRAYVGAHYDQCLAELRRRGQATLADKYDAIGAWRPSYQSRENQRGERL